MSKPRIPTEIEIAELAAASDVVAGLAFERDMLRELVQAKSELLACYRIGKRPSERLLTTLERLSLLLFPEEATGDEQ